MRPDRSLPPLPNAPLVMDQICRDPGAGEGATAPRLHTAFPQPFLGEIAVPMRGICLSWIQPSFSRSASFPLWPQRAGAVAPPLAPPPQRCLSAPSIPQPGFSLQKCRRALPADAPRGARPGPGTGDIREASGASRVGGESYVRGAGFGKGVTS